MNKLSDIPIHGNMLQHYRNHLSTRTIKKIRPDLQGKVDLSGAIQETLLDLVKDWPKLQAIPEAGRLAWLEKTFDHNIKDLVRRYEAKKRDSQRESPANVNHLPTNHTSPFDRATNNEQLSQLLSALNRLPEQQREVLILHFWKEQTLDQIVSVINLTKPQVAGLIYRGLKKLKTFLDIQKG